MFSASMGLLLWMVIALLWALALPIAIGYWSYGIWQRKGRSPWTGFILGFLLTLLLTLLAGLVFVAVSYGLTDRSWKSASW